MQKWAWVITLGMGVALGAGQALAARKAAPRVAPLSPAGEQLQAQYATLLAQLKAEILQGLPKVDAQKRANLMQALKQEQAAEAQLAAAQGGFGSLDKANGLVHHAHWWIGDAEKRIVKAQTQLKTATTPAAREAAQKTIVEQQKRREAGLQALKEREAMLAKAKQDEATLVKNRDAAQALVAAAKANTLRALDAINPQSILANDALDTKLIKFEVLYRATPRGLAAFAAQGPSQQALVNQLLADNDLMRQMVLAGGASGGQYGRAMEIYTAIQKASPKAASGNLQRLALAVALELATPLKQKNAVDDTSAPQTVDPVQRYLAYEKAYLDGELDPAFKNLSTWDYRFVVDDDAPDAILAWGRQMLHNYRPDQIAMPDYRWRYVDSVKTEVQYGSQEVKNDSPKLQEYQNIIANGGVCGRRAWFGDFILRAFGIPTIARPQRGHAALAHWTPEGWVVNLGAGWGSGWTKTVYGDDLNFLAVAQARQVPQAYIQVQRAGWIGNVEGEHRAYGLEANKKTPLGFWNVLGLARRREIIEQSKAKTLAAVGTDIGEANQSKKKEVVHAVAITAADRQMTIGPDGVITIPAAACSNPRNSTAKIRFMPSDLGGMQLHYSRLGGAQPFEYTFEAPAAGKYTLTARVVTTSANQHLQVATNSGQDPVDIAVPYTVGMWGKTPAVEVTLVRGRNVLRFSRKDPVRGLTIRDFTLTPVK